MVNPIVLAAAQAAGPVPEGGDAAWLGRVKLIAINLTLAEKEISQRIELLQKIQLGSKPENGGTKGWGIIRGTLISAVEEHTKRALITYEAFDRESAEMKQEHIRTDFLANPDAAALLESAQSLIGHEVDMYKYQEAMQGNSGRSVRLVAHIVDRGFPSGAPANPSTSPAPQQRDERTQPAPAPPAPAPATAPAPEQPAPVDDAWPPVAAPAGQTYTVVAGKRLVFAALNSDSNRAVKAWEHIGNPTGPDVQVTQAQIDAAIAHGKSLT